MARTTINSMRTRSNLPIKNVSSKTPTSLTVPVDRSRINTLPTETLLRIFDFYIGQYCYFEGDRPGSLITLTSVCARWREIVSGTATLWSHVDFGINNGKSPLIGLWLERSNDVPLHIHFQRDITELKSTLPSIVEVLAPHVSRIMSLKVDGSLCHKTLLPSIFRAFRPRGDPADMRFVNITGGKPDAYCHPDAYRINWPVHAFKGLVELNLSWHGCPMFFNLIDILQNNPTLVVLRLRHIGTHVISKGTRAAVQLPQLRVLDLHDMSTIWVHRLLELIHTDTPELHFEIISTKNTDAYDATMDFMSRTSVTSFCFWASQVVRHRIGPVLEPYLLSAPLVRSLVLYDRRVEVEPGADRLTIADELNILGRCQHLKHLGLVKFSLEIFDMKEIHSLAETLQLDRIVFSDCKQLLPNGEWHHVGCECGEDQGQAQEQNQTQDNDWLVELRKKVKDVELDYDVLESWDSWDRFVDSVRQP